MGAASWQGWSEGHLGSAETHRWVEGARRPGCVRSTDTSDFSHLTREQLQLFVRPLIHSFIHSFGMCGCSCPACWLEKRSELARRGGVLALPLTSKPLPGLS